MLLKPCDVGDNKVILKRVFCMLGLVTSGMCTCSFGVAPTSLVFIKTVLGGTPFGNHMDMAPFVNVPTFGMCNAPSNPAVQAATAAAFGVPTPAPCTPVLVAPWIPGPVTTMIGQMPSINMMSKLMCAFGGVISPIMSGQYKVMIQK